MRRLDSLQVLRFAAALGVVHSHVALNFHAFGGVQVGAMGVDLFFVLSGFIISTTARASPEAFLLKRAIRVLPPWYLWLIPWLLLAEHGTKGLTWRGHLASFALWPATDVFTMPYLNVGWSLCYEALFYAGVWLVLRGLKWWIPIVGYALAIAAEASTHLAIFKYLGSPMVAEFLFGVALAFLPIRNRALGVAAIAAAAAWILSLTVVQSHGIHRPIIGGETGAWLRPMAWGLPAALLVLGALQFPKLGPWARPLTFLGDASYSTYLTHLIVVVALVAYLPAIPPALAVVGCVAAGAAAYLAFEWPVLRILRRLFLGGQRSSEQHGIEAPDRVVSAVEQRTAVHGNDGDAELVVERTGQSIDAGERDLV